MKNTKTFKILLLPTKNNEKGIFCMSLMNIILKEPSHPENNQYQNRHLYIISDNEIKEGDWCYHTEHKQIGKFEPSKEWEGVLDYGDRKAAISLIYCKKIVATTHKNIYNSGTANRWSHKESSGVIYLPQIPKSFIYAYIKAYNEGKPITEVDLEMYDNGEEGWSGSDSDGEPVWNEKWEIKTRPDNTVIIHQSKLYTRDEVERLCNEAYKFGYSNSKGSPGHNWNDFMNKWIENNLK